MLVLAASAAFSWVLTFERVPQKVGEAFLSFTQSPSGMLMLIATLLLIAGMFVEGTALILILAPMFLPIVTQLGIDPVHRSEERRGGKECGSTCRSRGSPWH